jgi:hypothetical protein
MLEVKTLSQHLPKCQRRLDHILHSNHTTEWNYTTWEQFDHAEVMGEFEKRDRKNKKTILKGELKTVD